MRVGLRRTVLEKVLEMGTAGRIIPLRKEPIAEALPLDQAGLILEIGEDLDPIDDRMIAGGGALQNVGGRTDGHGTIPRWKVRAVDTGIDPGRLNSSINIIFVKQNQTL